ncbi:MAG: 23S rRNA (guanosine(2251)-2'-O)-methyltransferase RlmB [Acidobacteria bacterium]|nr:23S rRNA (guanosine(2251)-2'-O)-methyltransferase RlmB [Acidobacteriota bacterium]
MSKREAEPRPDTVYGINAVREAVRSRPVEYVLVAQGQSSRRVQEVIETCRKAAIAVRFAPRAALDREAGHARHQDVVAVCSAKAYDDLETLVSSRERPLLVVLDSVEDPGNLGAIVRTAVAAGAGGLLIPQRRAAGLSPAVARAAAGALEHLKIARVTNLVRSLVELKEQGIWVYGFEAQAEKSYLELDYTGACALVLGGEGRGLHRLVRETCDVLARIPLHGPVQSLNVSVAAAVVLYEAARQRNPEGTGPPATPASG